MSCTECQVEFGGRGGAQDEVKISFAAHQAFFHAWDFEACRIGQGVIGWD